MTVTICIVTRNRVQALSRLLGSPHLQPRGVRVWVLNQASTDGTEEALAQWAGRDAMRGVWNRDEVMSAAEARQWLVDRALAHGLQSGDVLAFLDDDIEITQIDWLRKLCEPLQWPGVQIAGAHGFMVTRDGITQRADVLPGPVDYAGGGWCAVRGEVFLSGIAFDAAYEVCYWEDVDLCFQVTERGGIVWGCGDVGLVHHHASDGIQRAHEVRNRARFLEKWGVRCGV